MLAKLEKHKRHRFDAKSEKVKPKASNDNKLGGKRGTYKKRADYSHLDREIKEIDLPESAKYCHCGSLMKCVGYDTSEVLSFQPSKLFVVEERRLKYVCTNHSIKTALAPARISPKVLISDELLAELVIAKCLDRQPHYHIQKRYSSRYNTMLPRDNISRWFIHLAEKVQPIYNLMLDKISYYDIASIDATKLQVLKEDNRALQTSSKAWVVVNEQVVLFKYSTKSNKTIDDLLLGFEGYLHGDADTCYKHLKHKMVYCNAHSKRHYEPIFKKAKDGIAEHVINTYQRLYQIEDKVRDLDPQTIKNIRQQEAKPIWDEFKIYLEENLPKIPPKSNLADAVGYTLRYYEGLTTYLTDGRLYIDNNHTERIIRQFVLARNNFMFADTVKGAESLCIHFSIIQTAILNGVEPYDYYCKLFQELPHCQTVDDYEKLLPWNMNNLESQKVS